MSTSTLLAVDPAELDAPALIAGLDELGALRRRVDAALASFSAEVAHRSRRDHGFAGLAASRGARTPENLVQQVAGVSKREAGALVRVGEQLTMDADPWLASVGSGVEGGRVSIEKADIIAAGLGAPSAQIAADDLADAAVRLVELAPSLPVEQLAARAREARDELDAASVRDRYREQRSKRFLTLTPLSDGMTRLSGLLDAESAAVVGAAYDAATSPRRGGPRFVDPLARAEADELVADERTIAQIALDTFVDLLSLGTTVAPERMLRSRRHAVRVLVTDRDLRERSLSGSTGAAFFGDSPDGVPVEVAERHLCDAGLVPILFDESGAEALRVGRTQRLHTARQRDALAARDGGCRWVDCDRPVSWTEAHHTIPWSHGGSTDVDTGILLCRHHHMLVHDNGWEIRRDAGHGFVAIPPRERDPERRPIPMPPKSRAAARLRVAAG